jgi:membrane associated rhomboid family serine protease
MFQDLTPVVRALLYTNFIVYLLQRLTGLGPLLGWEFGLWPPGAPRNGYAPFEPWQLVTYGFLHGGWMHLFGNMLGIWMFGPDIERFLGSRRFTLYYFACIIGGALTQLAVDALDGDRTPLAGASGAVFGLLLFFGLAFPSSTLLLAFAIPIQAWLAATVWGLVELYLAVFDTASTTAHFGHLGGMAAGAAMILFWRRRLPQGRSR